MAQSKFHRALGRLKDQTRIGLAMIMSNNSISVLDITIVKATRHNEHLASQRHLTKTVNLTCYSRRHVSACVTSLSKRMHKTRSWVVALKSLMLVHRLLMDGDPAFENELFFKTWRGERILSMSEFKDGGSLSSSWDFTMFVRNFARYLEEQLQFCVNGLVSLRAVYPSRREMKKKLQQQEEEEGEGYFVTPESDIPVREMKIEQMLLRSQQLQELLERFLACRPTGEAKSHRVVIFALQSLVEESFQIYFYMLEIMAILIERFMELEIPHCMKVLEIFCRASTQFTQVDNFYNWCKTAGIGRSTEYPRIKMITPQKLAIMDNFIRDKAALGRTRKAAKQEVPLEGPKSQEPQEEALLDAKALPAPESSAQEAAVEEDRNQKTSNTQEEGNFINLEEDSVTAQEHEDRLVLALFAGEPTLPPTWEAFEEDSGDWETALVETASKLSNQKASLGGGFDMLLLDTMYQQAPVVGGDRAFSGSASSMAFAGGAQTVLALPAPPVAGNGVQREDPFAASLAVPPPAYVQMWEMERKQQLLVEEQQMWQQYSRDGNYAILQSHPYKMVTGGYPQSDWC